MCGAPLGARPERAPPPRPPRTRPRDPGRRRRSAIHRRAPLGVPLVVSMSDPEIDVADLLRDRSDLALGYLASVDVHARRDLRAGAAEEDLLGNVELAAVDLPLRNEDPELGGDLEDRVAGDALEDIVGHRRRYDRAVAYHEQVRPPALRDVPVRREEDGLIRLEVVCLIHRKGGVDVRAGELAPRRDGLVGGTPPARGLRGEPAGR